MSLLQFEPFSWQKLTNRPPIHFNWTPDDEFSEEFVQCLIFTQFSAIFPSQVRWIKQENEIISKRTPCVRSPDYIVGTQQQLYDDITQILTSEESQDAGNEKTRQKWHEDSTHIYHGCKHYLRECKIECDTCKRFFACRICHDKIADHKIDRTKISRVFCYKCRCIVPFSLACSNCGQVFAFYKCDKCRFLNGNPHAKVFHCDKCLRLHRSKPHNSYSYVFFSLSAFL